LKVHSGLPISVYCNVSISVTRSIQRVTEMTAHPCEYICQSERRRIGDLSSSWAYTITYRQLIELIGIMNNFRPQQMFMLNFLAIVIELILIDLIFVLGMLEVWCKI